MGPHWALAETSLETPDHRYYHTEFMTNYAEGYLDSVRLLGTALYSGDFTVPTAHSRLARLTVLPLCGTQVRGYGFPVPLAAVVGCLMATRRYHRIEFRDTWTLNDTTAVPGITPTQHYRRLSGSNHCCVKRYWRRWWRRRWRRGSRTVRVTDASAGAASFTGLGYSGTLKSITSSLMPGSSSTDPTPIA